MKNQLKNRLEVEDLVFFYDRKTLMEKTKVISVDKKAKTATLENMVIVSRYPNSQNMFTPFGKVKDHVILRWDDSTEQVYKAYIARKQVEVKFDKVTTLLRNTKNILQASEADLETLTKLNKYLTKLFNPKN